ncbi:MAG: hypothetical protein GY717_17260 [Rhodobacteraceae bacterium]|nr:hypothetical protein [Paracoccaceae bacterium]
MTAGVDITGLDPLGDAGSFSLQASRLLGITENSATFLGASYSGLLGWGAGADQEKASVYLTHFRTFDLGGSPVPVLGTIGYGQNVRYTGYNTGVMENGLFWGAGVGVSSFLSASLSGTDNQLNAGVGIRIPGLERVSISAGYYDVTDNVGRRQASVTVGYGISDIFGGF